MTRERERVVLDGGGHGGGVDEGAGDLDERQQAVRDVVGVVRRGEPREVHPRPPDAEEAPSGSRRCRGDVPLDELVVQRR